VKDLGGDLGGDWGRFVREAMLSRVNTDRKRNLSYRLTSIGFKGNGWRL
jgi:hypothetical protein